MSTSQKIVDNVLLTAIGRLSMAAFIPLVCGISFVAWTYAESRLGTQTEATNSVSRHADTIESSVAAANGKIGSLQERVVALETLQARGAQDRVRFQDQVIASLADINRLLAQLSASNAANTATLEILVKDRARGQ